MAMLHSDCRKSINFVIARPQRGRGNLKKVSKIFKNVKYLQLFQLRFPRRFAPRNDRLGFFDTLYGALPHGNAPLVYRKTSL